MAGPLVMAGLTDGPRYIQADPQTVAEMLSDIPSGGLVEIKLAECVPSLRHSGRAVYTAPSGTAPSLYSAWQLRHPHDR